MTNQKEIYKIVKNGDNETAKYDFTLSNGINIKANFNSFKSNSLLNSSSITVEVYDIDKNDITNHVLENYFNVKNNLEIFEESSTRFYNDSDVHHFISYCKNLSI